MTSRLEGGGERHGYPQRTDLVALPLRVSACARPFIGAAVSRVRLCGRFEQFSAIIHCLGIIFTLTVSEGEFYTTYYDTQAAGARRRPDA